MAKKYYAYLLENSNNNSSDIVESWDICKEIVHGKKARYKSFPSYDEALKWLDSGAKYNQTKKEDKTINNLFNNNLELEDAIYFDSGTGRGRGVEVRVTDKEGKSLILESEIHKNFKINEFQNIELGKNYTNNFGELLGLYCAIEIARKKNKKLILGDSQLVIYYWTIGRYHSENLNEETISLIQKTIIKRNDYEAGGGKISFIKGDINPADLGFHK